MLLAPTGYQYPPTNVTTGVRIFGGWDSSFTTRDPVATPTRIRGLNSAVRFMGDYYWVFTNQGSGRVEVFDYNDVIQANPADGTNELPINCDRNHTFILSPF